MTETRYDAMSHHVTPTYRNQEVLRGIPSTPIKEFQAQEAKRGYAALCIDLEHCHYMELRENKYGNKTHTMKQKDTKTSVHGVDTTDVGSLGYRSAITSL